MSDQTKLEDCVRANHHLGAILTKMLGSIDPPRVVVVGGYSQPRFAERSVQHVALMKAVRIISGLNACVYLISQGYTTETMVLLRTIDDFNAEIMFILEDSDKGEPTNQQQKFMDDFYHEIFEQSKNLLDTVKRRDTVPKKKVWASLGRWCRSLVEPNYIQNNHVLVNDTLSGYIHGAYPHIMELYGGAPPHFHLNGMKNTPRIPESINQVCAYTHRSIMSIYLVAKSMGLSTELAEVGEVLTKFESATGYDHSAELDRLSDILKL